MNLPDKILICGKWSKIVYNKNHCHGSYNLNTKKITVGSKNEIDIKEILLHEIFEGIMHERSHRFTAFESGNDGIRFVMDHPEMENMIKDLSIALESIYGV